MLQVGMLCLITNGVNSGKTVTLVQLLAPGEHFTDYDGLDTFNDGDGPSWLVEGEDLLVTYSNEGGSPDYDLVEPTSLEDDKDLMPLWGDKIKESFNNESITEKLLDIVATLGGVI